MVQEDLLAKYRDQVSTGKLVTSQKADNALGTDVTGYVLPMFDSQVAVAYNPAVVKDPPKTYAELVQWVNAHPKQFGYNGIKGGMAGIGFVMGWVYANSDIGPRLLKGPYQASDQAKIEAALKPLRDFNRNVVITPGNAGTLDMLNRGEIAMGPVWVDMFYTWMNDGRLSPDLKLVLLSPGMPGQPMYYAIPAKAAQPGARAQVHRARDQPGSAGERHRQAVQLVSRHRRAIRARRSSTRRPGTSCSPTSRRRTSRPRRSPSRCRSISRTCSTIMSAPSRSDALIGSAPASGAGPADAADAAGGLEPGAARARPAASRRAVRDPARRRGVERGHRQVGRAQHRRISR